jgi:hypothetical protein
VATIAAGVTPGLGVDLEGAFERIDAHATGVVRRDLPQALDTQPQHVHGSVDDDVGLLGGVHRHAHPRDAALPDRRSAARVSRSLQCQ